MTKEWVAQRKFHFALLGGWVCQKCDSLRSLSIGSLVVQIIKPFYPYHSLAFVLELELVLEKSI